MASLNVYPKAKLFLADPSNYRTCWPKRATFSLIVLHVTDGHERAEDTAAMWQRYQHGSSAHFVIGQDGTVIQAIDIGDVAWHAHEANNLSIGIEHCARTPGELGRSDLGLPLSGVQMIESAALVAWLCRGAGLPIDRDHIKGHAEADPQTTHIGCPTSVAGGWDWENYMNLTAQAARDLASSLLSS
jgi:N-acetyl-anhydromuramyl-L-alanine amidase AmpD